MGYVMHQEDMRFRLSRSDRAAALKAVQNLFYPGHPRYSWVTDAEMAKARTFEQVIDVWGWSVQGEGWDAESDELPGDITGITFEREKAGDEDILFGALAPYVEAGSYIEMRGEDGDRWRWVFDGRAVRTVHARVVWDG